MPDIEDVKQSCIPAARESDLIIQLLFLLKKSGGTNIAKQNVVQWRPETEKEDPINDLRGIFGTESEAVAFALKAGKGWIDTQPAVKDLEKNNDR